jgi:hypothetical protein
MSMKTQSAMKYLLTVALQQGVFGVVLSGLPARVETGIGLVLLAPVLVFAGSRAQNYRGGRYFPLVLLATMVDAPLTIVAFQNQTVTHLIAAVLLIASASALLGWNHYVKKTHLVTMRQTTQA